MKFFLKHSYIYKVLILILILILIFFQFIKIDIHYFDTKFKALPDSLSLQGLECIGEKNELFIISETDGGLIYKLKDPPIIASFKNTDKTTLKEVNFMAHPTSLIKKDNTGIVVNSFTRMPSVITSYGFKEHIELGVLSNEIIKNSFLLEGYKSLHIELVKFDEDEYIILHSIKNSRPTFEFIKGDDLPFLAEVGSNIRNFNPICEISSPTKIHNLYWDSDNSKLFLSRNIIGSRGSKLDQIKFINPQSLKNGICPNFVTTKSTIFLTSRELEGYSKCGDSEYFIYNHDQVIYKR